MGDLESESLCCVTWGSHKMYDIRVLTKIKELHPAFSHQARNKGK